MATIGKNRLLYSIEYHALLIIYVPHSIEYMMMCLWQIFLIFLAGAGAVQMFVVVILMDTYVFGQSMLCSSVVPIIFTCNNYCVCIP